MENFDLVNMAVVLHEIRPNTRYGSIANCYKALKDCGEIVIFRLRLSRKSRGL